MAQTGSLIWITGLSGAGKSTLAKALQQKVPQALLLDGDALRAALGATTAYDRSSRVELGKTYVRLAALLVKQGAFVIVATISMFKEVYELLAGSAPQHILVYLNTPLAICQQRNPKGIYSSADSGAVVGASLPCDEPPNPHLVFNTEAASTASLVDTILAYHHDRAL